MKSYLNYYQPQYVFILTPLVIGVCYDFFTNDFPRASGTMLIEFSGTLAICTILSYLPNLLMYDWVVYRKHTGTIKKWQSFRPMHFFILIPLAGSLGATLITFYFLEDLLKLPIIFLFWFACFSVLSYFPTVWLTRWFLNRHACKEISQLPLPPLSQIGLLLFCFIFIFILPTYASYTERAHVTEGLSLSIGTRLQIAEFYERQGRYPADNHEAGLAEAEQIKGNAVKSIRVDHGVIIITYNKKLKEGVEMILTPELSIDNDKIKLVWECATNRQNTAKTITERFLPSNCRTPSL